MSRKTIKFLEREFIVMKDSRDQYKSLYSNLEIRNRDLVKRTEELSRDLDTARRDSHWHKQLNQNLSEAICYHMKSR